MSRNEELYKRIQSEQMTARNITNNDLVCKDCLYKMSDIEIGANVSTCHRYESKPNKVLAGKDCDFYENVNS